MELGVIAKGHNQFIDKGYRPPLKFHQFSKFVLSAFRFLIRT